MTLDELDALREALRKKRERESHREARLFAVMHNLHVRGKKVWKPEDFLTTAEKNDSPEAQAAIQAYTAERQRKKRSSI